MSSDKFIYPSNHHYNQDTEHLLHPRKFLCDSCLPLDQVGDMRKGFTFGCTLRMCPLARFLLSEDFKKLS